MTAQRVRSTRRNLNLSRNQFAILVGAKDGRIVPRWESGERDVPGSVIRVLDLLERMTDQEREKYVANLGIPSLLDSDEPQD